MPILDPNGNPTKPQGPRRTICQHCDSVLIEGKNVALNGTNIVTCPACAYKKLLQQGMKPEQMIQADICKKPPENGFSGFAVGFNIMIKGLQDTQMVITEEDLREYLKQIDEIKALDQ